MPRSYGVGDKVVFAKEKASLSPGPRAKEINPAPKGDEYSYIVDKFWRVKAIQDDGQLVLITRRGKEHLVPPDHPNLRAPSLWEILFYYGRFPKPDGSVAKTG